MTTTMGLDAVLHRFGAVSILDFAIPADIAGITIGESDSGALCQFSGGAAGSAGLVVYAYFIGVVGLFV